VVKKKKITNKNTLIILYLIPPPPISLTKLTPDLDGLVNQSEKMSTCCISVIN
jgi:hypothetical protein